MITKERKQWIKERRQRGDIAAAVARLHRKGCDVTAAEAYSIISGFLFGEHGMKVWVELERVIKQREKLQNREKEKYAA